jgi:hypothetical protein
MDIVQHNFTVFCNVISFGKTYVYPRQLHIRVNEVLLKALSQHCGPPITITLSVRLYACKDSRTAERICMKFYIMNFVNIFQHISAFIGIG